MKKIVIAFVVALATTVAASAQTPAPKKAPATKASASATAPVAKAKAHTMKAEVVSADAAAKTVTVKDESGKSWPLTATGGAVASLAKLKAGEWVMVTHMDTTATKITKAKATMAPKASKKK